MMETSDVNCDVPCRLCFCDLTTLSEYYAVDEGLRDLVKVLTDINVSFCCFDFDNL